MVFSLRSTVFALQRMESRLYHMGFRGRITSSALSDANNTRNWQIYRDFASSLIPKALALYQNDTIEPMVFNTVYAFDSTTIDLCLSVFGWASFRKTKAGIKLHTLLNLRGAIPVQIEVTGARCNDVKGMDAITPEKDAIYLFDRAYVDFARLYRFEQSGAFFVTRCKDNTRANRRYSATINKQTGICCDQTIVLSLKKVPVITPKRCVG
jgi:hypothetical protein